MKILITGGTGFVGYNISQTLTKNNQIYLIKRTSSKKKIPKKITQVINYENIKDLDNKLKKIKANIVIHAATYYKKAHCHEDLENFSNSNILFGNIILENLKRMGVKKFINFSTVWEDFNAIDENPYNLYSAYKNAFSKIVNFYKKNNKLIKFYDLMISDTFGYNDNRSKIINTLKKNYKNNKTTKIISKNLSINLLNITDIERAISILINNDIKPKKYLLKNSKNIKIKKLVTQFNKLNKKKIKISWGSKKILSQRIKSYHKLIGWKPEQSNINEIIKIIKN